MPLQDVPLSQSQFVPVNLTRSSRGVLSVLLGAEAGDYLSSCEILSHMS